MNAWYTAKFIRPHDKPSWLGRMDYLRTVTEDARSLKEGEGDEHQ